jgi:hypothetical protein
VTTVEAPGVVIAVGRDHRHAFIRLADGATLFCGPGAVAPMILGSLRYGDRVRVLHDPDERPREGLRRRVLGLRREL